VADTLQAFDNGKLIRNDVANSYLFSEQQASTKTLWVNSWLSRATGADFRRAYAVALLRHYTWTIERLKESPDGLLDHADEWATLRERMPSGKKTWMANLAANAIGVGRGEARYRCAIAAVAAEQFRLSNGRWPASLDELVPARLAVVPRDPFTSQPLRLARHPEGIVIYSVGDDKKDDGGDVHVGQPMGRDIGVRLWNVDKRRQPPR
jgi:hypothetical protein